MTNSTIHRFDLERYPLAYCFNVFPTNSVEAFFENLECRAPRIGEFLADAGFTSKLGVGLWFPADLVKSISSPRNIDRFRKCLSESSLQFFTCNGFPYSNFHDSVVKHRVYEPNWADDRRRDYTNILAHLTAANVVAGSTASISTLPLGWPTPKTNDDFFRQCAKNLWNCIDAFEEIDRRLDRHITLCLEPEPGCVLDTAADVIEFLDRWILAGDHKNDDSRARRYLRVCHDVCHSAVMGEGQHDAITAYEDAGWHVGKLQISSVPTVRLGGLSAEERQAVLDQLEAFSERRYLHQTNFDGELYDDLPEFLEASKDLVTGTSARIDSTAGRATVHFHVPVYLESLGLLSTTQAQIAEAIDAVSSLAEPPHLEVETYAWDVLPIEHQPADATGQPTSLEESIAREIVSVEKQIGIGAG